MNPGVYDSVAAPGPVSVLPTPEGSSSTPDTTFGLGQILQKTPLANGFGPMHASLKRSGSPFEVRALKILKLGLRGDLDELRKES